MLISSTSMIRDCLVLCKTAGLVPNLIGPPGVGKTTAARDFAAACGEGYGFHVTQLSTRDAADTEGIPFPDHDAQTARWYAPDDFPKAGPGLWLLDEFDRATEEKAAALDSHHAIEGPGEESRLVYVESRL